LGLPPRSIIKPQKMRPVISVTLQGDQKSQQNKPRKTRAYIRLMTEKINSAEAISDCIFLRDSKVRECTFSEVPNTKNVDERDEEAE
jgi:hypothetical protein